MARPATMMFVALAAAAAAGLPQLTSATGSTGASNAVSPSSAPTAGAQGGSSPAIAVEPVTVVRPTGVAPFERTWLAREAEREFLFRNSSSAPLTVKVAPTMKVLDRLGRERAADLKLIDAQGHAIDSFPLGSNEETILTLRVSPKDNKSFPLPATGFFMITSAPKDSQKDTRAPKTVPQEITIPEGPSPGFAGFVFLACLVAAALLVGGTVVRLRRDKVDLLRPMGDPAWTSGKSWGVNLAIGATLLTTLLNLGFPEHPWLMPKASFTLLQGIFAALVAMAPLIYGLFQSEVQVQVTGSAGAPVAGIDRQGNVLLFLLASGLILWGALGGAVMLFLALLEFVRDSFIDPLVGGILLLVAAFVCLLLVLYGWRALYRTACHPGIAGEAPPLRQSPAPVFRVGEAIPAAAQATVSGPVPQWPLL